MTLSRGRPFITEGHGLELSALPPFEPDDPDGARVDPREWFARPDRQFEIEIGSGKGTFLVQQAPIRTDVNYLGIEWAGEFYRYAADRMRRRGYDNVRMLHADATEFLRFRCPDAIAAVVHLYFSDPWPKKRHHKRRVMQDRFLADVHRVLIPQGELRLVTDHEELWAWYVEHATRHGDRFERRAFEASSSAGDGELVGTNYERKFVREGRGFWAMTLGRVEA